MVKKTYLLESNIRPKTFCVRYSDFCKCKYCLQKKNFGANPKVSAKIGILPYKAKIESKEVILTGPGSVVPLKHLYN